MSADRPAIRVKAMLVAPNADGTVMPVVWRPIRDADEPLPLYPAAAVPLVHGLAP